MTVAAGLACPAALPLLLASTRAALIFLLRLLRLLVLLVHSSCRIFALLCSLFHSLQPVPLLCCPLLRLPCLLFLPLRLGRELKLVEVDAQPHLQASSEEASV